MGSALQTFNAELSDLIRKVLPSTVTIEGYSKDLADNSQGSGWIYGPELVVTNHHVIKGLANPMTVSPVGRAPMQGEVIGSDSENDIAVIRVQSLDGPSLELESTPPKLGEICVAIGSPHSYRESASMGIISGLSRQIRKAGGGVIEEMIQTDASVNPGNSGGPLVNIHGHIVGMNTLGPSETVNLAVPAETLAAVVPELVTHGSVLRASIGISITVIDQLRHGCRQQLISVSKVKDTKDSLLEEGDLLLEINGRRLERRIDVIRALGRETVDQRVVVLIERNGQTKTVELVAKARAAV
jgi:S1-C subfamily serine protease